MFHAREKKYAKGFSLIEAMISMLILAFGVLAMGGLQLASLRSSQSSGNLAIAASLAKDLTELMRSNLSEASKTSGNPYLFDSDSVLAQSSEVPSHSDDEAPSEDESCKKGEPCTSSSVSAIYIADWTERVKAQLPGGRAVVCRDSTPRQSDGAFKWACDGKGSALLIKLGWVDKRDKEERGATTAISAVPLSPQLVMGGLIGHSE